MPNPISIQNKITALKFYFEKAPERLTQIRDLCLELAKDIDSHLQSQNDKRQYTRLDLTLPIKYIPCDENGYIIDDQRDGLIRDISLGGVMLEMKERRSPGEFLLLNLLIKHSPIQIKGRIMHIKDLKSGAWLAGIEFTEIEERDLRVIFRFLADNYN
jgi:hypothetical protein